MPDLDRLCCYEALSCRTVDCADQTLYYRDGQLVDRYIVQENPDGTFDYAYGTDQEYGIDYKKG